MINKKALDTKYLKLMVLDEADEMLSKIFANQIYDIFRFLPNNIQVGLFSATMTPEFFRLSDCFMRNPIRILVKNEDLTLEGIRQYYINLEHNEYKYETLCDLYDLCSISQTIIYCNSRTMVEELFNKLSKDRYDKDSVKEAVNLMLHLKNSSTKIFLISNDNSILLILMNMQRVKKVFTIKITNWVSNILYIRVKKKIKGKFISGEKEKIFINISK